MDMRCVVYVVGMRCVFFSHSFTIVHEDSKRQVLIATHQGPSSVCSGGRSLVFSGLGPGLFVYFFTPSKTLQILGSSPPSNSKMATPRTPSALASEILSWSDCASGQSSMLKVRCEL